MWFWRGLYDSLLDFYEEVSSLVVCRVVGHDYLFNYSINGTSNRMCLRCHHLDREVNKR